MNKIGLISLLIVPVVINQIKFSNIFQQTEKINIQKEGNNQLVNWNIVHESLDKMLQMVSYQKNKDALGARSKKEFNKILQFVKVKNIGNISQFKKQNFNLNQLNDYIFNQNQGFKLIFQNSHQYFHSNIKYKNIDKNDNLNLSNVNDLELLKKYVHNLRISKVTFTTIAATAAVAAAGFWAAAWWFGISIPWAVGSTVASVLAGGASSGITIALAKYDKEMNKWIKTGSLIGTTYSLGHIFYNVLFPIFVGLSASATAVSWAFPALLAVIPISVTILSWISLYR